MKEGIGVIGSDPGSGDGRMEEEVEGIVQRRRSSVVSETHISYSQKHNHSSLSNNKPGWIQVSDSSPLSPFCTTGEGLRGEESRALY